MTQQPPVKLPDPWPRPPLPGGGDTWARFRLLADWARRDLSAARLLEGHVDALAILAESTGPTPGGTSRWAVWAAEPGGRRVQARHRDGGWLLTGAKPYASGAGTVTDALVTAVDDAGARRLFAVTNDPRWVRPVPGSWPAVGMAGSDSRTVRLHDAPGVPVGGPGGYLDRPGFWHGAVGVAACWYGGAEGVADALRSAGASGRLDPFAAAHLGAVDAALFAARCVLSSAAGGIDADPGDRAGQARRRALRVRAVVEQAASTVLARVGRALGAGPLCHDAEHAQRAADLTVYLRQSHGDADLAALGELALTGGAGC